MVLEAFERRAPEFGDLLYERLADVIGATLFRMLGRQQVVTTLVKGRFARACSLRSWAAAITSRIALNALRSRRTERRYVVLPAEPTGGDEHPHRGPDPEREVGSQRQLEQLRGHLGKMSEKLAETLVLHDALGHDLAEIAVLTGVTVSAAQSRLVRGRKELARRVSDDKLEAQP
jgi:RNA polymerase sigma-70 factor (ECF subfamily)